jgi:DNA-binding winged helix-turn-helix (wHTH) protein/Tol biopolymer transport system component
MKAALSRAGLRIYQFGPFRLIPERLQLTRDGRPVAVGPKALELLVLLVEQAGQVVNKKELMDRLWPETFVEENNLAQAVSGIRQALADNSGSPQYVKTVPRRGYMFAHPVQLIYERNPRGPKEAVVPTLTSVPVVGETRASERSPGLGNRTSPRSLRIPRGMALVGVVALTIIVLFLSFTHSLFHLQRVSTSSMIAPPFGWEFLTTGSMAGPLSLSPDNANAVFGAKDAKSQSMLFLRSLTSQTSEPIAGTEGASMPFWSPDGHRIGFFSGQRLKTLDLRTRSVHVVCGVREEFRGGTWETGDTILFAESTRGPILKVPASGGTPVPVTELTESHFTTHRWPESLPDGKHFLFLAANHEQASTSKAAVFLGSLDGHSPRFVVESDSNALFVAGQLLFVSGGKLLSQPFDPGTGSVGTAARILTDTVEYDRGQWHAAFAATPRLLVYRQRPKTPETQVIAFLDDSGKVIKTASRPGSFQGAVVSPDGKTVATMCGDPELNICLVHQDGTLTRISESPIDTSPVWSSDGLRLVYATHRGAQRFGLALKDLKAQNPERVLAESNISDAPTSWSPDEKELLIEREDAQGHFELGVFRLADHKYRNFLMAKFKVAAGKFSPDGKWVAYQSDESGQDQIYIASYPDPRGKYAVSQSGGQAARWGQDGRELYFMDASDMIYRVRIETVGAGLKIGAPQPLFRPAILPPPYDSQSFDVSGKEPLFVVDGNASKNDSAYTLVTSWVP